MPARGNDRRLLKMSTGLQPFLITRLKRRVTLLTRHKHSHIPAVIRYVV